MRRSFRRGIPARLASDRGVALPLALLGLVTVSLLVSAALVGSSTEVAISLAHQDGAASLHGVDGALQRYVATKAEAASAGTDSLYAVQRDPLIPRYQISVARLHQAVSNTASGTMRQRETFALTAEQANGRGRVVGSLITTVREVARFAVNVTAGLTVGGNVQVTGSSTISDGRSTECDSSAAPNALQVSAGSTITRSGASVIEGKADTASYRKEEMIGLLLGGTSLREAARMANIKFAAGEFNGRVRSHDSSTPRPRTHKYNWGCPKGDACGTVAGNEANRSYRPIVAIDAGGGKVTIEGDHGQGILIIYNGNAEMRGNLLYQGIVLVEKDLTVQGTGGGGGGGVKLEGAVIAFGQNSSVEDNVSGNAVITYNRCIIADAQAGMDSVRLGSAPQQFPAQTFGWIEVVR